MKYGYLLLLLWVSVAPMQLTEAQTAEKKHVILDVDTSGDDIMAILYLLGRSDVEIKGITVVRGVSGMAHGTELILRLMQLTGHPEIPVACGADVPMEGSNAFPDKWQPPVDKPYGLELPPHALKPSSQTAKELLRTLIEANPNRITIMALGPMTNIAGLFLDHPELKAAVREIYVSDGAVHIKGAINLEYPAIQNSVSGWNQWVDPKAAALVFASGVKITLVPLDVTALHAPDPLVLSGATIKKYTEKAILPSARALAVVLGNWISYYHTDTNLDGSQDKAPVWDLVTAEIFTDPDICTQWEEAAVRIMTGSADVAGQIVTAGMETPETRICLRGDHQLFDGALLKSAVLLQPVR
jgi:inosine-uridine nucleoside N-ribohydrolase